jgi:hypothetical protein
VGGHERRWTGRRTPEVLDYSYVELRQMPPTDEGAAFGNAGRGGNVMIMRILGEGQYEIAEEHLAELNELDSVLQAAVDAGDEPAYTAALSALLTAVRALGTPLPDETIIPSDLVLPDSDMSLRQIGELLSDEGLIPG